MGYTVLNFDLDSKQQPIGGPAEQLSPQDISTEMIAVRSLKTLHLLHRSVFNYKFNYDLYNSALMRTVCTTSRELLRRKVEMLMAFENRL